MFSFENTCGKCVRGVTITHRYGSLGDNWTLVHLGPDEMDRTSGNPDSCRESPFVRMQSLEARQQRRMDIDHPIPPCLDEAGSHQSHEARKRHEFCTCGLKRVLQSAFECLSRRMGLVIDRKRFDTAFLCPCKSGSVRPV